MYNKSFEPLDKELERVARLIVDSTYKVHSKLGPGFLINFNVPRIKDGIRRFVV